jgi:hypothetical protein
MLRVELNCDVSFYAYVETPGTTMADGRVHCGSCSMQLWSRSYAYDHSRCSL